MAEVQYLGHRVGCGVQRPEPAKIEAILDWPTPVTKTQVLAFLGTAGYYRKFVPRYSDLAKPLTDLTKKSLPRQVLWSPECEQAFQQLKAALTQAPLLAAPDYNRRFIIHTDASMFGLGAVLSQVGDDGGDHPVAFISRKLLPREVGYAAVEKECLALVWALRKFQPYVYGRSFTVLTDHNPLVWLNRVAGENGRLLRWSLALQPFNFTIQYRPGTQNGNADGLSRQSALDLVEGGVPTTPARPVGVPPGASDFGAGEECDGLAQHPQPETGVQDIYFQ
uniref:Reverse transcriptase/retrotransposon-derived protein RNase H-like domain-containing protein n=1 Tax=Leptobrachium leishanense TaxID=445787 RepID=A0A8C5QAG7_9ANUR